MGEDETVTVTVPKAEWEAVLRRLAALEATTSRREPPPTQAAERPTTKGEGQAPPIPAPPSVDRRRALLGLAGAAAAVAGAVAIPTPAAAADGDIVRAGQQALPTLSTSLRYTAADRLYGFGVIDTTQSGFIPSHPALYGHSSGGSFDTGVLAQSSGSGTALLAYSAYRGIGAFTTSTSQPAVEAGAGTGGLGMRINSDGNHLQLYQGGTTPPPARSTVTLASTITATEDGDLWLCVESGVPGTWRKVGGLGTAGSLHVLPAPVRVYDSRPGTKPAVAPKTPLTANTTRVIDLTQNSSGVPAGSTAALLTVLLVNATAGNGNLTVWANGVAKPSANTLVWGGSTGRFTAEPVTALDPAARIQVSASLTTDIVVDVVGYYR